MSANEVLIELKVDLRMKRGTEADAQYERRLELVKLSSNERRTKSGKRLRREVDAGDGYIKGLLQAERMIEAALDKWNAKPSESKPATKPTGSQITELEYQLLDSIASDEYQPNNGGDPDDGETIIDSNVWSFSPCQKFGKSAGGIMGSLVKKGFAGVSQSLDGYVHGMRDDATCWITKAGFSVYQEEKKRRERL